MWHATGTGADDVKCGPMMIMMMIMTMGSEHRIPAEVETYLANEYLSVLVASQLLRTAPLQDLLEEFEGVGLHTCL